MYEQAQSTHGHRGVAHPKLSPRTQIRVTHLRPRQHPPVGNRFVSFMRATRCVPILYFVSEQRVIFSVLAQVNRPGCIMHPYTSRWILWLFMWRLGNKLIDVGIDIEFDYGWDELGMRVACFGARMRNIGYDNLIIEFTTLPSWLRMLLHPLEDQ